MEQQTMEGFCKNCKRKVIWIKHADFSYWVCTVPGCHHRSRDPKKEKEIITQLKHYFTYIN